MAQKVGSQPVKQQLPSDCRQDKPEQPNPPKLTMKFLYERIHELQLENERLVQAVTGLEKQWIEIHDHLHEAASAEEAALQMELSVPIENPVLPEESGSLAEKPVLPVEQTVPVEEPALQAEQPAPVEEPVLQAEQPVPVEEPAWTVEQADLDGTAGEPAHAISAYPPDRLLPRSARHPKKRKKPAFFHFLNLLTPFRTL